MKTMLRFKRLLAGLTLLACCILSASAQPKVVLMGDSITELWAKYHPGFFTDNGIDD